MSRKGEFIRNRALKKALNHHAKRVTAQLIVVMSDTMDPQHLVVALEHFTPIIEGELDCLLARIEDSPALFLKEDAAEAHP